MRAFVVIALLVACKHEQSPREALALVCDVEKRVGVENLNPAERQAKIQAWLAAHVTNAEIKQLFATSALADPATRRALLADAARRHGIASCPFAAPRPVLETVPEVTGAGVVPQAGMGLVIVVSGDGISVEDKAIVAITGGDVDPSEREGRTITRLAAFVAALPDTERKAGALVAFDRSVPYRLAYDVLASAAHAGVDRFGLAATKAGSPVMVPIEMPKRAAQGFLASADKDVPLQLVVTVKRSDILLWSLSGLEGTLVTPAWTHAREVIAYPLLADRLREIKRRHPGDRDELDRTIIVMVDDDLTAADLLQTASTVAESFPDVLLGASIQ